MNLDSEEEPTVPSKLLLNLPDEVVPSSRGIPLHTRYTRRNQIQVITFRKLVHVEDGDILDLLTPCEDYDNHINFEKDYVMHTLIGRVLYGFDIHDSRYGTIDDPNPCEIMTHEGGMYLVPDQMSDWFLYKDGKCVALPVLQRFKHCITDARLIAGSSGPFIRLVLKPVQSLNPGQDSMLQGTKLCSAFNYEDSDLESFTSGYIDPNLMNISKSPTEDSLAEEIANCWNSPREGVLVVLRSPTPMVTHFEESCDINQSGFTVVQSNDSNPETPQEVEDTLDFEDEYTEESEIEDKDSGERSPCGDPIVFPLNKPYYKDPCGDFLSSSVTPKRSSITSLGLVDFHSRAGADHNSESYDDNTHYPMMIRRPSLIADTDPQAPIIIELGAGVIGFEELSMSYLHKITIPNPSSDCWECRDASLESMELQSKMV